MIVKDVRTTLLHVPYVDPPRFKPDFDEPRQLLVVEVELDNGIVGLGYLQPLGPGLRSIDACLHEMMKPVVLGADATCVEALWQRMYQVSYTQGRMGVAVMALSAIDIALWDALGKHAGLPLWRLWGGVGGELAAYGSGCWRGLGGDGMIAKAQDYVGQGFTAIKMQAAHLHPPAEDVRNVKRMREALGEGIALMIDINMGWTADQAIEMGRRFEPHGVYWLEEPVPAHDTAGYLRVARALDLRVVGGENHFGRADLAPFFAHAPLVPILQPDVMRGGLTELRKIAAVAEMHGIRIAPHLFSELMVHLNASIPNAHSIEYMGWLDDLFTDPPRPERGVFRPPEAPGHGLAFRPEVLRDFRLKD